LGGAVQFFTDLGHVAEERFDEAEQFLARGREFERATFVERDAEVALERVDLGADGGLLDAVGHEPHRAGDATRLGDVIEKLQLVRVHIVPAYASREFYQLTPERQSPLGWARMSIVLGIMATVLIGDFVSGFFHWLEDAYGREDWPITGRLITKYNILHHHDPRHFTRNSWLESSWIMICIVGLIVLGAWALGVLTWQVWLFAAMGVNINQIHKWAHRTPAENGRIIRLCHRLHLLQTPRHHAGHHTDPKSSHYCVLTNFLNPVLDRVRFWQGLEWLIWKVFRARRREDASVSTASIAGANNQPKPTQRMAEVIRIKSTIKTGIFQGNDCQRNER